MGDKIVGYNLNIPNRNGSDNLTQTLMNLLNSYPGLTSTDEILFQTLEATSGKAMFPTSSVVILKETDDVTGHVTQECTYPFLVVYRASGLTEGRKANVKEWLDDLGRWLEKQEITVNGTTHKLDSYPSLNGDMEFTKISRQVQSYLYNTTDDKAEDWAVQINANYRNEFDRD